jgi:hypothetical protein
VGGGPLLELLFDPLPEPEPLPASKPVFELLPASKPVLALLLAPDPLLELDPASFLLPDVASLPASAWPPE